MWYKISGLILRNRPGILLVLALLTAGMIYMSQNVEMRYKFGGILPATDTTQIDYHKFLDDFSQDGNVIVLGAKDPALYKLNHFNAWYDLAAEIKTVTVQVDSVINGVKTSHEINAVDSVFSIGHLYQLERNDDLKKFEFNRIVKQKPETQAELDSLLDVIHDLPFYDGLLYNEEDASLMMLFVNANVFNSEIRIDAVAKLDTIIRNFEENHFHIYKSGLPYIRTIVAQKIKKELGLFVGLSALITALLLYIFFRNLKVVFFSILVVLVGVIWSTGIIGLFDYKLSALMGLIPPLMIVIGIPNCVFLLNKYQHEYRNHGNKIKALSRVIQKIGTATFMTNCTTAIGFATFIFTSSDLLKEFGVIASVNILVVFFLSILLIPIFFSYLPDPTPKETKHLDRKWVYKVGDWLVGIVSNHRKKVYPIVACIILVAAYGVSKIQTTGNIVDDLPDNHPILTDLRFFETNFNGVMPLEIIVDTKRENQALNDKNLRKLEKLQKLLGEYPEISRSLSVVDAVKFAKQSFYGGQKSKYQLMNRSEKRFIGPYISGTGNGNEAGMMKAFVDSAKQRTRVSAQVADIGTIGMEELLQNLTPRIDSIFNTQDYKVTLTGTSVVFVRGTNYLVKNLFQSMLLAVIVISLIMAVLFQSFRMVLISLVPNLLPFLSTAAIMGYFGIAIKPSTILVFSIAFGISVDDTIHFLAKYRQELNINHWNIRTSVINAVRETGTSMIYTSVILFFGFGCFAASEFGGTRSLGILISVTLLIAMATNLILLPSLLMSFNRHITNKAFKEPLLVIIDEEEDIDLTALEIEKPKD